MGTKYLDEYNAKLGFGFMRLPKLADDTFNMDLVKKMVDVFLAEGFTYFDTAYSYPGSEEALREALVKRFPRERYSVATKMPVIQMEKPEDAQTFFQTSLNRTGVDFFDYYLFHALNAINNEKIEELGAWQFVCGLKASRRIKHLGFSFHGTPEALDDILTRHPEAEFVQLQINYLDWDDEKVQAYYCYETARKHGVPITVMEPIKGGLLANPPQAVKTVFHTSNTEASPASWALRFAASLGGIATVLSGMNSLEQLYDNIATLKNIKPLSIEERDIIAKVVDIYRTIPRIPCTGCRYCLNACPNKIRIPNLIDLYNDYMVHNSTASGKDMYPVFTSGMGKASDCIQCHICKEHCPQGIDIATIIRSVAEVFE